MPRVTDPPRVPPRAPSPSGADAAPSRADVSGAATVDGAPGITPEEAYLNIPDYNRLPSTHVGTSWNGYSWKADDLDAVMKQFAVGDAMAVIRTAVALDRGDRILSAAELKAAARELTSYQTAGHRWSPSTLADVMQQRGLAEETALLRAAKRHDNGDRFLDRGELERAADVLVGIVKANDIDEVQARIDRLEGRTDVEVEKLGEIEGHPVRALHFGHTGPGAEPRLEVLVTGGVHGSEPCGTGAAMLLVEQLLADPRMREEVAFTVVPLMNPRGYEVGSRRTPEDDDLNRHMHLEHQDPDHRPAEVEMLEGLLERSPSELVLDLHSGYAKRNGFWVYHRNAEDMALTVMDRLGKELPLLTPDSNSRPMPGPGVVTSDPPPPGKVHKGTLKDFAIDHGARWAFTVEAPGSISYLDQVMGENELVHQMVLEARLTLHREELSA